MPLHDSFKQPGTSNAVAPMKLAKMSSVPTPDDLMFALSLAQKNQRNIVELPWKSTNNPNNYIIKVTCSQNAEEPTWFLHVGGDEDQPVLWNYETPDASLIHSLVSAECERTTYTAPLEHEAAGAFPTEVQLPDLPSNGVPEPYLPREHEQPLPSFSGAAERPVLAALPPPNPFNQQTALPQQNPNNPQLQQSAPSMTNQDQESRQSVATAPRPLPAPVDLDRGAVDSIYKSFTNADTGFISHAAFLFFLVNEFNRYQKDPKPLSVVRFDMCVKPLSAESTIAPMPQKAVQEAGKRIFSVMRPLDWAAHYEQEFAILMPFTARAEAGQLAHRMAVALMQTPLVPGLDPKMLGISIGVASMPDDCTHPGILLAAAQDAKNRARKAGVPVMLFSDGI
ncbi:hypothetical protein BH10CYA1_BH10CYA1_42110 [soil metagenome]